ncbi:MAG: hypothetical protein ACLFUH_01800 [Bacteroidales bacterium]
MKTQIINKTPHPVVILDDENNVIQIFESQGTIRLSSRTERIDQFGNIPISKTEYGEPEGLPDIVPETLYTYYIVSQLVKNALPNRPDLLVPAEVVRDEKGNIIGCKSLGI